MGKLKLDKLKIQSFVTSLEGNQSKTVKGGGSDGGCNTYEDRKCLIATEGACNTYDCTEDGECPS